MFSSNKSINIMLALPRIDGNNDAKEWWWKVIRVDIASLVICNSKTFLSFCLQYLEGRNGEFLQESWPNLKFSILFLFFLTTTGGYLCKCGIWITKMLKEYFTVSSGNNKFRFNIFWGGNMGNIESLSTNKFLSSFFFFVYQNF